MKKEDVIVAIYTDSGENGANYNILSGFLTGLKNGFNEIGVKALTTKECIEQKINPNLAIAFDSIGLPLWQKTLNNNIPNIMWSTNSIFYQNLDIVKQFINYKNFILFNPSSDDTEALKHYLPSLVHGYIPPGVDLNVWKKQDIERDLDITLFASIEDPDILITGLKETMPPLVFDLMMNLVDSAIANPGLSLWHLYQYFNKQAGLEFDLDQYTLMAKSISYVITFKQRIKMVQSLKDFNLTIFGDGPWEKFVSEKTKVEKRVEVKDTVNLMNRSKITLHSQPFQLSGGIHNRVLNASAVATPVLCAQEKTCISEFKNNVIYCNPVSYEDITEKAFYYLNHKDERDNLANEAYQIVKNNHKWSDRAKSIIEITDIH